MTARLSIIEALADRLLFGAMPAFRDLSTWRSWLVFLAGVYGLPLSVLRGVGLREREAEQIFCRHTGRSAYAPPPGGYREAAAIVGRQAGKDSVGSVVQDYEAAFAWSASDGGGLYSLSICQDARAALRTQLRYARAPFEQVPMLRQLVDAERADALELNTGVTLASYPCRPASIRGLRAVCVVCSELAFFRSTEGYPTDVEMLRAVRPTLATTGGKLIVLSSPYAQSGALYELHRRHYGRDDSGTLVWQATAPAMNPTLPADYLSRMEQDDPEAYRSEVLGEFRAGLTTLLDPEAVAACVEAGVRERPRQPQTMHVAHVDAASGAGRDSFALAIAHRSGDRAVLDVVRAWKPPFNPSGVVAEAAQLLRAYGLGVVTRDTYAPGFVDEAFRAHGVACEAAGRATSDAYLELVPLVYSRRVVLLDDADLLRELRGLERRRGASGRDRVDHRPGAHDDRAAAVAGAMVAAAAPEANPGPSAAVIMPADFGSGWQSRYFTRGR